MQRHVKDTIPHPNAAYTYSFQQYLIQLHIYIKQSINRKNTFQFGSIANFVNHFQFDDKIKLKI